MFQALPVDRACPLLGQLEHMACAPEHNVGNCSNHASSSIQEHALSYECSERITFSRLRYGSSSSSMHYKINTCQSTLAQELKLLSTKKSEGQSSFILQSASSALAQAV